MYKYETHLHTKPVSACAHATVRENLEFYKSEGYDGIFITNHFVDGNIAKTHPGTYEERMEFYCSDYDEALKLSKEIGIKVFFGIEMSYLGTDFLVYGLDREWLLKNPQICEMNKRDELEFLMQSGALVVQAHPFREAGYIDHIRLFPRSVHGVEIINANRTDFENEMARLYAEKYGLLLTAGTDNHMGASQKAFAGIMTETPIESEADFVKRIKSGSFEIFHEIKQ